MKKLKFITIFLLIIFSFSSLALTQEAQPTQKTYITNMRYHSYSDKLRVVIETDLPAENTVYEKQGELNLLLKNTTVDRQVESPLVINDMLIPLVRLFKKGDDMIVNLPVNYHSPYEAFVLDMPPRLVIDLSRNFTDTVQIKEIEKGLEYLEVVHGSQSGIARAHVLRINLKEHDIIPVMAGVPDPTIIESFFQMINPFTGEERISFDKNRTSSIAKKYNAKAAINGSFYNTRNGMPYGILMINEEIMASPLMERTALAITEENNLLIGQFASDDYAELEDGTRIQIKGINTTLGPEGVALYTSRWGKFTPTNDKHLDIIVKNNKVKQLKFGSSYIPSDGYVLSVSGPPLEFTSNSIKPGDKIKLSINIIPMSPEILEASQTPEEIFKSEMKVGEKIVTILKPRKRIEETRIKHMIGGGPRLVKTGNIYVSKFEERFKYDVALARAARTAIGLTKNHELIMVVVDGRKRKMKLRDPNDSIGMTLEELSRLLIYLGAQEAMNLDGGGSATMVINDKVVNEPCDGAERQVGNALLIL